jgi:hypothetical protein
VTLFNYHRCPLSQQLYVQEQVYLKNVKKIIWQRGDKKKREKYKRL